MDLSNYMPRLGEEPLDRMVEDGGYTAIFRSIAVIGDSFSSGEHESTEPDGKKNHYNDYYEYSWGQYIARTIGSTVYNFSCAGMTAEFYWNTYSKSKDCWNTDKLCQAYIIALGVNDLTHCEFGSSEDINLDDLEQNKSTFCGYYARIIQKIKQLQPKARIFLMTIPRQGYEHDEKKEKHAKFLYELAEMFEYTYVLDFNRYAPVYDNDFAKAFFLGGHMNAMGYWLTAKMVMSYIDYIVRNNMEDFIQVAFIGKDCHNYKFKW